MKSTVSIAALLATAFAFVSTSASAQSLCSPRDKVVTQLSSKYSEAPIAVGVTNNGKLVEVLTSGDGNTWTIIMTSPQGMSCVMAVGEAWQSKAAISADPEA
jgi:hypothetical protein